RPPVSPHVTASTSSGPATMVNTMSRPANSAGESTTLAPFSAKGSALERVRFHTHRSTPASRRRLARANPILPVPTHPTLWGNFSSVISTSLLSLRSEEHTSELQSRENLVCRLLLEKKKKQ